MAVTATYSLVFDRRIDLLTGPGTSLADVTSLANGGIAATSSSGSDFDLDIFTPDLAPRLGPSGLPGTNAALDQLSDGNIVIVSETGFDVRFRVVDGAGRPVVGATDLGDLFLTAPDVAGLARGGFVIAAQDRGVLQDDIEIRIRDNRGRAVTEFSVDATAADDRSPAVCALDDGGFAVAWTRTVGLNTQVWYAVFEASGATRLGPTLADATGSINRNVDIASKSGGFAIVYEDNGWATGATDITLAEFSSAGRVQNFTNINELASGSDPTNQIDPRITRLSNDLLAVGYVADFRSAGFRDDNDAFVALYDPATDRVLDDAFVGAFLPLDEDIGDLAIAGSANGRINVFYTDFTRSDIGGDSLVGRRTSVSDGAGDTVRGDDFQDIMFGNGGADTLIGLGNNDTLDGGDNFDTLLGGEGADTLIGGTGGDVLNGGPGNDTMRGGADGDLYVVDSIGDIVEETGVFGTDTINTSLNEFSILSRTTIEDLRFVGGGGFTGTGNALANRITGGFGDDTLRGNGDGDVLSGGGGSDRLFGESGDDSLRPGLGLDRMTGGPGNDRFRFAVADIDSAASGLYDNIYDYSRDLAGGNFDRIELQGGAADYRFVAASTPGWLRIIHIATGGTIYVATAVTADPAVLAAQVEYFT